MPLWTKRKFWDGTEAIFVQHNGSMTCYDLDSDELADIIQDRMDKCTSELQEWIDLKKIRMEFINGKASD